MSGERSHQNQAAAMKFLLSLKQRGVQCSTRLMKKRPIYESLVHPMATGQPLLSSYNNVVMKGQGT